MCDNTDKLKHSNQDVQPTFDHCGKALHAQTRQAEEALKKEQEKQSKEKDDKE